MRRCSIAGLSCLMALMVTCGTVVAEQAAEAQWSFKTGDPGPTVWCEEPAKPIHVDGKLDEWDPGQFQIALDKAHMTGNSYYDPPIINGDADCSGRVALAWDGAFLFIALKVRDDVLAPVDPEKGYGKPWFHDGLMLHLHAHAGLERSGRYGKEFRRDPSDRCALLGLSYYQSGFGPRSLPGESRYVARSCEGGYELEAAIELKALGYTDPRPGDRLKLALILVDQDPGAPALDAFGQLVWQFGRSHGNPHDWADLRLMRGSWGVEVIACTRRADEALPLCIKMSLDAARPGVTFKGVRLLDEAGNQVLALPAARRMKPGQRLTGSIEVNVSALAEGTYEVHPVVEVAGREFNGWATTQVALGGNAGTEQPPTSVLVPDPGHFSLSARYYRPPTLQTVNKEAYLDFLKEHARPILERHMPNFSKPWRHAPSYGFLAAYLYAQTGDPFYAEVSKAALESSIGWTEVQDQEGSHKTEWQWLMVDLMRQTGLVPEDQEPRVRQFLLTTARRSCWGHYGWKAQPWRRGAGHSSLGPAVARYYALVRIPQMVPEDEARTWRKYFELTWNDWWQHRDTIYNDTGYRALLLNHIFLCAYLTGREDLFTDPEAMKFWERLLHTTAPCGAVPHYGDTNGWSTEIGMYAFYFEYLAAKTGDGRFKHAAHRIFDYIVNHCVNVHDYHMQAFEMVWGIALAHMVADDSVEAKAPGRQSRLLTRKEIVMLPKDHKEEFGHQVYGMVLGPRDVPDKIVFKSSDRPEDLWAMIDLCGAAGHNEPPEPTNVAALVDKESVLTCNQGYMDETPDLHNVVFAEDLEGKRFDVPPMAISVPEFYDRNQASYARVRVENYHGWPIDEERQFLFGRYRFLLLKDVLTFKEPWMCRIGPCWQAQQVGPEIGPNWANTYVANLFLSGLGTGGGFHRWKNPHWDLLVYHPLKQDCSLEVVNRFEEQPYRVLPVRLRYAWEGMGRKGERLHFTTLLLPHDPVWKPSELIKKIRVLADTPSLTAIHVATDRYYEDWMLLNDTGEPVTVGELETDARQLHLCEYKGRPPHKRVMAEGGTFVRFRGKEIARVPAGKPIDMNF